MQRDLVYSLLEYHYGELKLPHLVQAAWSYQTEPTGPGEDFRLDTISRIVPVSGMTVQAVLMIAVRMSPETKSARLLKVLLESRSFDPSAPEAMQAACHAQMAAAKIVVKQVLDHAVKCRQN